MVIARSISGTGDCSSLDSAAVDGRDESSLALVRTAGVDGRDLTAWSDDDTDGRGVWLPPPCPSLAPSSFPFRGGCSDRFTDADCCARVLVVAELSSMESLRTRNELFSDSTTLSAPLSASL